MKQMWLFILTFLVVGGSIQAQDMGSGAGKSTNEAQNLLATLSTLATTPEVAQKVLLILQADETALTPQCGALAQVTPQHVYVLDVPTFNAQRQMLTGSWMLRYQAQACGQPVQRSVLFEVSAQGLSLAPLVAGATLTDPALQRDVRRSALVAVQDWASQCAQNGSVAEVVNTVVAAAPTAADQAWQELLIVRVCGQTLAQRITFTPNAEGTAIDMLLVRDAADSSAPAAGQNANTNPQNPS